MLKSSNLLPYVVFITVPRVDQLKRLREFDDTGEPFNPNIRLKVCFYRIQFMLMHCHVCSYDNGCYRHNVRITTVVGITTVVTNSVRITIVVSDIMFVLWR